MGKKYYLQLSSMLFFMAMFIWSVYLIISTIAFLKHAVKTQGVVVKIIEEHKKPFLSEDYENCYLPVINFTTESGKQIQFSPTFSSCSNVYPDLTYYIGQEIPLYYSKKYPSNAKLISFIEIWLVNLAFFVISGCTMVYVILNLFKVKRIYIKLEDFMRYAELMHKNNKSLKVVFHGEHQGNACLKFTSQFVGSKVISSIIYWTYYEDLPEDIKNKIQNKIEPWVFKE